MQSVFGYIYSYSQLFNVHDQVNPQTLLKTPNIPKPYMEKRAFVAWMAILAKKKLAEKVRKSRQNLA